MRPAARHDRTDGPDGLRLTDDDRAVLARVEPSLADGEALLRWWQRADADDAYARRFDLVRTFNRSDTSFAFFDRAPVARGSIPVMGVVEDMLYDQPKHADPAKVRDELRE